MTSSGIDARSSSEESEAVALSEKYKGLLIYSHMACYKSKGKLVSIDAKAAKFWEKSISTYSNDSDVDFFTIPISPNERRNWLRVQNRVPQNADNVHNVYCRNSNFACMMVPALFMERGLFSGHTYQPKMNHRSLNYSNFHKQQRKLRPLIASMVDPEKTEMFHQTPIAFYPYELRRNEGIKAGTRQPDDQNVALIRSQNLIEVSNEDGTFSLQQGFLEGAEAIPVSVDGFQRTLEFFGLEWRHVDTLNRSMLMKNPTSVEIGDLHAFFDMFKECTLADQAGFEDFVERFHLHDLFTYDPECSSARNFLNLSNVIRACVPLRIGVFDGQHRFSLASYFATGMYNVTDRMAEDGTDPFDVDPSTVEWPGIEEGKEVKVENFQLFHACGFSIGIPEPKSIRDACTVLEQFGVIQSEGQKKFYDSSSWPELCKELVSELITQGYFETHTPFNFKDYWNNKNPFAFKDPFGKVWTKEKYLLDTFIAYVNHHGSQGFIGLNGAGLTAKDWAKYSQPSGLFEKAFQNPMMLKYSDCSVQGMTTTTARMVSLIRYACFTQEAALNLTKFFNGSNPQFPQMLVPIDLKSVQFDLGWLQWNLITPIWSSCTHFWSRVQVEKKLVKLIRTGNNNAEIKQCLDNGNFNFSCFTTPQLIGEEISDPGEFKQAVQSDQKLAMRNTTNTTMKLLYAYCCTVTNDVISVLNQYGLWYDYRQHVKAGPNDQLYAYLMNNDYNEFKKSPSGNYINGREKSFIDTLLQLFPCYLRKRFAVDSRKLEIMHKECFLGKKETLNIGKEKNVVGLMLSTSIVPETYCNDLTNLADAIPTEWLFSDFVRRVMENSVNTHEIPEFSKHLTDLFGKDPEVVIPGVDNIVDGFTFSNPYLANRNGKHTTKRVPSSSPVHVEAGGETMDAEVNPVGTTANSHSSNTTGNNNNSQEDQSSPNRPKRKAATAINYTENSDDDIEMQGDADEDGTGDLETPQKKKRAKISSASPGDSIPKSAADCFPEMCGKVFDRDSKYSNDEKTEIFQYLMEHKVISNVGFRRPLTKKLWKDRSMDWNESDALCKLRAETEKSFKKELDSAIVGKEIADASHSISVMHAQSSVGKVSARVGYSPVDPSFSRDRVSFDRVRNLVICAIFQNPDTIHATKELKATFALPVNIAEWVQGRSQHLALEETGDIDIIRHLRLSPAEKWVIEQYCMNEDVTESDFSNLLLVIRVKPEVMFGLYLYYGIVRDMLKKKQERESEAVVPYFKAKELIMSSILKHGMHKGLPGLPDEWNQMAFDPKELEINAASVVHLSDVGYRVLDKFDLDPAFQLRLEKNLVDMEWEDVKAAGEVGAVLTEETYDLLAIYYRLNRVVTKIQFERQKKFQLLKRQICDWLPSFQNSKYAYIDVVWGAQGHLEEERVCDIASFMKKIAAGSINDKEYQVVAGKGLCYIPGGSARAPLKPQHLLGFLTTVLKKHFPDTSVYWAIRSNLKTNIPSNERLLDFALWMSTLCIDPTFKSKLILDEDKGLQCIAEKSDKTEEAKELAFQGLLNTVASIGRTVAANETGVLPSAHVRTDENTTNAGDAKDSSEEEPVKNGSSSVQNDDNQGKEQSDANKAQPVNSDAEEPPKEQDDDEGKEQSDANSDTKAQPVNSDAEEPPKEQEE